MKCSEYNYYVSTDKGELIYNTIGDSFALLSVRQIEKLKSHDWGCFTEEQIQFLQKSNIIVDETVDEKSFLIEEYNISHKSPIYYLTLLPTLDCNVRCWYCFESILLPQNRQLV